MDKCTYIRLSYDINSSMPLYPDTPRVSLKKDKEILRGDSCNTSVLTISSHAGTHIDFPHHFQEAGLTATDYDVSDLVFTRPLLIDCPKGMDELVEARDLGQLRHMPDADLLLIRTGFQQYRDKDVQAYCSRNPCLAPDAARLIRASFPSVRCLGIDCISVSSRANRELGRETHRILLSRGEFPGDPVLIIEDMRFPPGIDSLDRVIVAPLFIYGLDGSPCTVIGVRGT